jgi:L-aspartate oxidase
VGQRLLVSEAVRGEGAVLVDAAGVPVMAGVHPMGDLAPRDVVATAIATRLRSAPGGVADHVFLDATSIGPRLLERFPTIVAACREAGIDPVKDLIPVAPAAHFSCGGVVADLDGVSSVPGLFAIGEVARTGVHGANRLASNGVTEGLVAGRRLGHALGKELPVAGAPHVPEFGGMWIDSEGRAECSAAMSRWVGPLRDASGLAEMRKALSGVGKLSGDAGLAELEATNLHTVSWLITGGASIREESRGCHRRLDAQAPSPNWVGRIEQRLVVDENVNPVVTHQFVPLDAR